MYLAAKYRYTMSVEWTKLREIMWESRRMTYNCNGRWKIRFGTGGKCVFQASRERSRCPLPCNRAKDFIVAVLPAQLSFSQFTAGSFFTDFLQVPASLSLPPFLDA